MDKPDLILISYVIKLTSLFLPPPIYTDGQRHDHQTADLVFGDHGFGMYLAQKVYEKFNSAADEYHLAGTNLLL